MEKAIKIVEKMIDELIVIQDEYSIDSNYSVIQDKIDTLYEVIEKLKY